MALSINANFVIEIKSIKEFLRVLKNIKKVDAFFESKRKTLEPLKIVCNATNAISNPFLFNIMKEFYYYA